MNCQTIPISIIPKPQSLAQQEGYVELNAASNISFSGEGAREVAELLAEYLRPATGYDFAVVDQADGGIGTIHLEATGIASPDEAGFVCEQYTLISKESGIYLKAENASGLARAIQVLRQLLPAAIMYNTVQDCEWFVPNCEIEDAPRFRWRGQHLDVCRHFFSVDEVCKLIDVLALHRLNMCHLHLTDDQGWRIEIKKYPLLAEVGSCRSSTLVGSENDRPRKFDDTPYGGFYTHEDIRTIVQFAQRRHITIVPEIDMPGHVVAAIAAYPELGNVKVELDVRCQWGISASILNVEDSTVDFMKNVLSEVIDLFPGRFIHVGGDEALKYEWGESQQVQKRMAELGLNSGDELQSWFMEQVCEHVESLGRRPVGWDEILKGGINKTDVVVMSWNGEEQGIEAAALKHDVVMTPMLWVYFDYYQANPASEEPLAFGGMTHTDLVYSYEPIPKAMKAEDHQYVLGSQGQLWTEYMPVMSHVEYMGFPRICALSEVLWLEPEKKDYQDFLRRLEGFRERLDALDVKAHPQP